MSWVLGTTSKSRLVGVNPKIIEIIDEALEVSPIDFGIPADGGKRTAERQYELFKQGVSKCDGIDRLSKHQSGDAWDFYAFVNNKASWDRAQLSILYGVFAAVAYKKNIPIRWGGTFGSKTYNGWDAGHIELL